MCRRKGDTFKKNKLKENKRVPCPSWTISENLLKEIDAYSKNIGISQSRIVESAIRNIFNNNNNLSKISHENLFNTPIL
jgi:hypothetical protein